MHHNLKFIAFLFLSVLLSIPAKAEDVITLAQSPQWLKLLHYRQIANDLYQGLVDNAEFYVSAEGKNNPLAEMQAEIAAFTEGQQKCAFPARFKWLQKQNLLNGNLNDCEDYQQFINDTQPSGITVLFTNAYMRNPASLFGHTLIRIDTARQGSQMLAHGSNFGANPGNDSGIIYAIKGLFGGYMG